MVFLLLLNKIISRVHYWFPGTFSNVLYLLAEVESFPEVLSVVDISFLMVLLGHSPHSYLCLHGPLVVCLEVFLS